MKKNTATHNPQTSRKAKKWKNGLTGSTLADNDHGDYGMKRQMQLFKA
jgi:hypothetical protein